MFTKTIYLPKGYRLTLTTDAVSSGSYGRIGNPGDTTSYGRAATTADLLRIENADSGAAATYDIIIAGDSA